MKNKFMAALIISGTLTLSLGICALNINERSQSTFALDDLELLTSTLDFTDDISITGLNAYGDFHDKNFTNSIYWPDTDFQTSGSSAFLAIANSNMEEAGTDYLVDNALVTSASYNSSTLWMESQYDRRKEAYVNISYDVGDGTYESTATCKTEQGNLYTWSDGSHPNGWPYGRSHVGLNGALRLGHGAQKAVDGSDPVVYASDVLKNNLSLTFQPNMLIKSVTANFGIFYKEDDQVTTAYRYNFADYVGLKTGLRVANSTSTDEEAITVDTTDTLVPAYESDNADACLNSATFELRSYSNKLNLYAAHDTSLEEVTSATADATAGLYYWSHAFGDRIIIQSLELEYYLIPQTYNVLDYTDDNIMTHRAGANAASVLSRSNTGSGYMTNGSFVSSVSSERIYAESNYTDQGVATSYGGTSSAPTGYGIGTAPQGALRMGTSTRGTITYNLNVNTDMASGIDCVKVDFGSWIETQDTTSQDYLDYTTGSQPGIRVSFSYDYDGDSTSVQRYATSLDALANNTVPAHLGNATNPTSAYFIFQVTTDDSGNALAAADIKSVEVNSFTIESAWAGSKLTGVSDSYRVLLYDIFCFYNHENPGASANWFATFLANFNTCQQYTTAFKSLKSDYAMMTTAAKNLLSGIALSDYNYEEYIANGDSYTSLTKHDGETNAYAKWEKICVMNNTSPASLSRVSQTTSNHSSGVIIITLISIAGLAVMGYGIFRKEKAIR